MTRINDRMRRPGFWLMLLFAAQSCLDVLAYWTRNETLPQNGTLKEILNSDDPAFGGSGAGNPRAIRAKKQPFTDLPWSAAVTLPPLSALFFEFRPIALRKHKA